MKDLLDFIRAAADFANHFGIIIGTLIASTLATKKVIGQLREGWAWAKHNALIPDVYAAIVRLDNRISDQLDKGRTP